jgi:hypothetical protein
MIAETTPSAASDITCFDGNTNGGTPPANAPLVISESFAQVSGVNDEFVEITTTATPYTVTTFDGSSGFSLAASNGVARFTIPNGTVIQVVVTILS